FLVLCLVRRGNAQDCFRQAHENTTLPELRSWLSAGACPSTHVSCDDAYFRVTDRFMLQVPANRALNITAVAGKQCVIDGTGTYPILWMNQNTNLLLSGVTIKDARTLSGITGAAITSNGGGAVTVTVDHCTFQNNYGQGYGGSIAAPRGTLRGGTFNLKITNTLFDNCSSELSGGAVNLGPGEHIVQGCTFNNCHANGMGGAINYEGGGDAGDSLIVDSSTFRSIDAAQS
ncbi:unnamed protein product, partial [Chrysoparadoxa australica]